MVTIKCKGEGIVIESGAFTACGGEEGEYVINTLISAYKIKDFCEYYVNLSTQDKNLLKSFTDFGKCKGNNIKEWVDDFFDENNPMLMVSDLVNDAEYLNIKPLYKLCVRYIAFKVQTMTMEEIANIGKI